MIVRDRPASRLVQQAQGHHRPGILGPFHRPPSDGDGVIEIGRIARLGEPGPQGVTAA